MKNKKISSAKQKKIKTFCIWLTKRKQTWMWSVQQNTFHFYAHLMVKMNQERIFNLMIRWRNRELHNKINIFDYFQTVSRAVRGVKIWNRLLILCSEWFDLISNVYKSMYQTRKTTKSGKWSPVSGKQPVSGKNNPYQVKIYLNRRMLLSFEEEKRKSESYFFQLTIYDRNHFIDVLWRK